MMALKSASALLSAIEGFRGETAGSKQHEDMNATLARVVDEIHKGSAALQDSPGKREARSAASREMPAEIGHDGGSGGPTSNKPGSAGSGQAARNIAPSNGAPDDKLSGAAAVHSRGNRVSVGSAPFPPAPGEIRRAAANKEASRPDTKYREDHEAGDGNRDSVASAPAAEKEGRIGDVAPPARPENDMQREAEGAMASSDTQPENRPPYSQESLKGDGWSEARAKAKKVMAKSR
jgi:hypothetical protein